MLAIMLDRIEAALKDIPEIRIAIVYGSFASGRQTDRSDLDLAVASQSPLSDEVKVDWITRLGAALGREIDLIDLNSATGTVLKEALTRGKTVLNQDVDLFARILKRMLLDEADFQETRRRVLARRRKSSFDVA
jgi:predicted nucleotidyltransferase